MAVRKTFEIKMHQLKIEDKFKIQFKIKLTLIFNVFMHIYVNLLNLYFRYSLIVWTCQCQFGSGAFESARIYLGPHQGDWTVCPGSLYIHRVHSQKTWWRERSAI